MQNREPVFTSEDRFVRAPEFYYYLGISKSQFYRMVREGKLPPPKKISPRTSVWTLRQVREVLDSFH